MLWWLLFKIIGLVMIVIGGMMVVIGPGTRSHQEIKGPVSGTKFGVTGIVLGLILVVVGGFILFAP